MFILGGLAPLLYNKQHKAIAYHAYMGVLFIRQTIKEATSDKTNKVNNYLYMLTILLYLLLL